MKASVSFIILSFNDAKLVINAIKSIKRLKTKYKFNIYVVDNGSKNNTLEMVKKQFKNIKLIKLPKNIGTAAYDKAVKKSKSEYIYFTGCDIELKNDMLDPLVDFMDKNKNVMQVVPKSINLSNKKKIDAAGSWLSRSFYSGVFKKDVLGKSPVEIPYFGTGLLRREFILRFGYLFDNDYFFYGEDVDLGLRIRLLGYKIYYIPNSVVYHLGSVSRKIHKSYFYTFLMERNLMRTFYTTLSTKNLILLKPYLLSMRLIAIIRDLLKLNFTNALARLVAIFWIIFNFNTILRKRNKIQRIRKVNDKELFKFFSEKYLFKI